MQEDYRDQIAALPVGEPSCYQGPNPRFAMPKEVACFSRDSDRKIHFDDRALRSYTAPALPVALDSGFEQYIPKDNVDDPAPLGDILSALSARHVTPQPGQLITFRWVPVLTSKPEYHGRMSWGLPLHPAATVPCRRCMMKPRSQLPICTP